MQKFEQELCNRFGGTVRFEKISVEQYHDMTYFWILKVKFFDRYALAKAMQYEGLTVESSSSDTVRYLNGDAVVVGWDVKFVVDTGCDLLKVFYDLKGE